MTTTSPASNRIKPTTNRPAASIIPVDPATAARWLDRNGANRNVRPVIVNKYATDMAAGLWCLTGAPIQFDANGTLLDGQHRLAAIVKSGVTVPMFVVEGLPVEAQPYMDIGAKRTVADQLGIAGYQNSATLASGARIALAWTTDQLRDRMELISDAQIREFVKANPEIADAAKFAAALEGAPLAASMICAVTWRLLDVGHTQERVHGFFTAVAEMRSDGPGDPKYALLHRLNAARRTRERIKSTVALSMVVRAFNADYLATSIYKMQAITAVPSIVAPVEANQP